MSKIPTSDLDLVRIRFERGDPVAEIARDFGVTTHGIGYHAQRRKWRRPQPGGWREAARGMYETGAMCRDIGTTLGVEESTVLATARRFGWTRKTANCYKCGAVVVAQSNRGNKRRCAECRAANVRHRKQIRAAAGIIREARLAAKRKAWGRGERTPIHIFRARSAPKATRAPSPQSEVSSYRKHGTRPTTREGALEILKRTLTRLLDQRCTAEGVKRDTIEYRAKYAVNAEFREREQKRTSGKRWGNRADGRDDGTLTREVVRRLFARAKQCPYCWHPMTSKDKSLDHMEPLSRGGWHSATNVLVCCRRCNSRKHDTPYAEWLTKIPVPCERALRTRAA